MIGSPVRMDGERADAELPPPALGEHTAEVLAALGLDPREIERLRMANVVG
jgi:crotonobetainyl-CoA:carnitine CoA-transferase CaiB-like acyl-CoA transferase